MNSCQNFSKRRDNLLYALEKINGKYGFRDEFSKAKWKLFQDGWMQE
ncbi:MAG: hypothetical protein IPG02_11805 [Ignavibacteria bacterium]|nr:hypothetical protein [Ignavibacteria bacterium]